VGADHAREGVDVGDGDGAATHGRGLDRQLIGMAGPPQEGEVAGDLEFGVRRE
jgi:hypothetical protein